MRIGIDEVGRGPVAGPVSVCAFGSLLSDEILVSLFPKNVLRDSKKLSEKMREEIFEKLIVLEKERKVFYHVSSRSAEEIDTKGISLCIRECIAETLLSIRKQISQSEGKNDIPLITSLPHDNYQKNEEEQEDFLFHVYLDGSLHAPKKYIHQETIIKGDEKVPVIACASILAKVTRDSYMKNVAEQFPLYGFENHVGYGTKSHNDAIQKYGPTPLHRKTFLKRILTNG